MELACSVFTVLEPCEEEVPAAAEPGAAVVTEDLVLTAFRRVPLPESVLTVQPPGGRTLVNFETNFFTEAGELSRSVRLLGQRIDLEIWPERFEWWFGDGESEVTTTPGAAYPEMGVTHDYRKRGRVAPRVDTTYAARWRLGSGEWRPVAGTVVMTGEPQTLRVMTARPTLVGAH